MAASLVLAAACLDSQWESKWICNVPLDSGRQKANILIAWRDVRLARKVIFAVHLVTGGSPQLAHTLSWQTSAMDGLPPIAQTAFLGRRREPLILLSLTGGRRYWSQIVTFTGAMPRVDPHLNQAFRRIAESETIFCTEEGALRQRKSAAEAGFSFKATGIGSNTPFARDVNIGPNREFTFGKWVEEPDSGPDFFRIKGGKGRDTYDVTFRKQNFRMAEHRISHVGNSLRLDGLKVFGTEAGQVGPTSREELSAYLVNRLTDVKVSFAGRKLNIPSALVMDCFNVHFGQEYLEAWVGRQSDDLFILLSGSDGAASYEVIWRITRQGKASRSIMSMA